MSLSSCVTRGTSAPRLSIGRRHTPTQSEADGIVIHIPKKEISKYYLLLIIARHWQKTLTEWVYFEIEGELVTCVL
jgi:hypothetical protein